MTTESSNMSSNADFVNLHAYDEMLERGISVSGEKKEYFAQGRVDNLKQLLQLQQATPSRILDFGCGLGETAHILAEVFPDAEVIGMEPSIGYVEAAQKMNFNKRVQFVTSLDTSATDSFDLCYVNGVFHHIPREQRAGVLATIRRILAPNAYIGFFENNIVNPGTRIVMRRIPFDREADPFTHWTARRLLIDAGFHIREVRFLFVFPRQLSFLRFSERCLSRIPIGAQYVVLGQLNEHGHKS